MTLADLRQEFYDRGFNYLPAARANRFINTALGELYDAENWPFRQASASGTGSVVISDLGSVESVIDTATRTKLTPLDRRQITDSYTALTTTGTPVFYYLTLGTTVNTYPIGGTLTVNYWKTPAVLNADTDVTSVPERFQLLIVDIAAKLGYADADAYDKTQGLGPVIEDRLELMRQALLWQQNDRSTQVEVIAGSGDW